GADGRGMNETRVNRIVLAYSGSAATTAAIPWLTDTYDTDVVTLTLDLTGARDLQELHERALAAGAVRAHVLDVREAFAREALLPALKSAADQDHALDVAAVAYPLIAR